jgi:hypothetical protein
MLFPLSIHDSFGISGCAGESIIKKRGEGAAEQALSMAEDRIAIRRPGCLLHLEIAGLTPG